MEIIIDRIKIKSEKQFLWKKDIIELAVKNKTVPLEIKDNFNCYLIVSGNTPDIEISDTTQPYIDANTFPTCRVYTCSTTCFEG